MGKRKDFVVVMGEEEYWVRGMAKGCMEEWGKSGSEEVVLNGEVKTVEELEGLERELEMTLGMGSLFGDRKRVWVKGLNCFGEGARGVEFKERMEGLVGWLLGKRGKMEGVQMVVSVNGVDKRGRVYKKIMEVKEEVEVVVIEDEKGYAREVLGKRLSEVGVKASDGVIELLESLVPNGGGMMNELEKLITYVGSGGEIREEDVKELVTGYGKEGEFFEFIDAIYDRDGGRFEGLLRQYLSVEKDLRVLIVALQNRNRLLMQLRAMMDSGKLQVRLTDKYLQELAGELGINVGGVEKSSYFIFTQNPWYLGRLMSVARGYRLPVLMGIQKELVELYKRNLEQEEAGNLMRHFFVTKVMVS